MHLKQKKDEQARTFSADSWRVQRHQNISYIKSAKRRTLTPKVRNDEEKQLHREVVVPVSSENKTANLYADARSGEKLQDPANSEARTDKVKTRDY